MDVQEVRKLENYMRRLFGNTKLRVCRAPKKMIPQKSIWAKNLSASSSLTTRMTNGPIISRWRFSPSISNSLAAGGLDPDENPQTFGAAQYWTPRSQNSDCLPHLRGRMPANQPHSIDAAGWTMLPS